MFSSRLPPLVLALALAAAHGAPATAATQEADAEGVVPATNAGGLPVSLDRIRRGLAATREAEDGSRGLLDLSFYVDVYARAPAIRVLRDFDLNSENVSYGAPTHREMLEAATPREWRPRAISTGNLFGWR